MSEHMPEVFGRGPSGGFEFLDEGAVLSPVETDRFLRKLNNELAWAHLRVRQARAAELQREEQFARARVPLLLDDDVPKVGTRAGEVTKATQDQWFADRLPDPYWALRSARAARQNAIDYARVVADQVEIMRSLNSNAKTIYDTSTGVGR